MEDIENLKPFDCGDKDLNDFLLSDARLYNEQFLANTFVLEDDNETVAYYSLLNDKISQTTLSKNLWRKLRKSIPHEKHLGSYPAVKIGRLAVSKSYRGMDIGTKLVGAIMRLFISQHGHSACRFLTVDAYKDAVTFYEKNGFKKMVNDSELPENALTVPLYLDLKQVES